MFGRHGEQHMLHMIRLQEQQMMQQQQQSLVAQQMHQQREFERQMKKLGRLEMKKQELLFGPITQGVAPIRVTKSVIEEFITNCLNLQNLRHHMNFVSLTDKITVMRHACDARGVSILPIHNVTFQMTPVTFGFCDGCGTVHYHYTKDDNDVFTNNQMGYSDTQQWR